MSIEETLGSIAKSLAQLVALAKLATGDNAEKVVTQDTEKNTAATNSAAVDAAEAKKVKAAKVRKDAAAKKKLAGEATKRSEEMGEAVEPPDPCTKEDVRTKLTTLTEELGRETVMALFQRLGVANLKGLDADQYADAWKLGDKALREGAEVITGGG